MPSLNHKAVVPTKFEPDSKFRFRCYPGISCFTRCCRNIEILLTPFDVIRMKQHLGMPSTLFLEKYTYYKIDDKTTQPLLFLKLTEDEQHLCPFVDEEKGCTIYEDRPGACRYYPIGQATHRRMDENNEEPENAEWYVMVREDHCRGFEEDREWTIQEWREDQGAALYDDANREWKNIMLKQDIPKDKVEQKRQQMFYMASYDIDSFRLYVLTSRFLEIFDVDPETLEKIKVDDVELMHFAVRYLKFVFGITRELDVKPHIAEEQRRRLAEMRAKEDADRAERIARIEARKAAEAEGEEG